MRTALPALILAIVPATADASAVIVGKARIEIGVRKSLHFLGENVLVDFCVVNADTVPLVIDVGGDYRGSTRALRFKVQVKDAKGVALADPDPEPFNMGGMGYAPKIEPGDRWCQSLALARYARIEGAGRYTITATHDLGWPAGKAPSGTAVITYAMPTAAEAEKVIAAMEALPPNHGASAGKVTADFLDYTSLRHDVYIPPLKTRAMRGKLEALAGLAQIPSATATRALVALLGEPDKIAVEAARALAMRLPDPALTGGLGPRNPFENTMSAQRKFLSQFWEASLADPVRSAARAFLATKDPQRVGLGAFMLEAVGLPADGAALIAALDAAIDLTRTVPAEDNMYPPPRGACMELRRAAEILLARKLAPPAAPRSPGELAVWLEALRLGARPAGWEAELGRAFAHPIPYVRQIAMQRAPTTAAAALASSIQANLAHADHDVVAIAAQLVEQAKLVALAPDVIRALPRLRGIRFGILTNTTWVLGAHYARAQALVPLLGAKDTFDDAWGGLVGMLEGNRSGGATLTDAQRASVAAAWKRFVDTHRAEIETGKPIALTTPGVTPDLMPPGWKLRRRDNTEWP